MDTCVALSGDKSIPETEHKHSLGLTVLKNTQESSYLDWIFVSTQKAKKPQEERKYTFKGLGYIKDFHNITFMV